MKTAEKHIEIDMNDVVHVTKSGCQQNSQRTNIFNSTSKSKSHLVRVHRVVPARAGMHIQEGEPL